MLNTGILHHGGVMVNYECNAACRHCLYSCSPTRKAGYVNEKTAEKICELLLKGGCHSVHIGGGEPFINFEGLVMMVRALNRAGISLEYIETNASWVVSTSNLKKVKEQLDCLFSEGVENLCISIDPYHAEYVPYGAPLALAELCDKAGMGYFLWKQDFVSALSRLAPEKSHSRQDMEKVFSMEYIYKTARNYGINYGGRAINIEMEKNFSQGRVLHTAEKLVAESPPCRNLLSTVHFHVDMDCFFIPPRCTGILIPLPEIVDGIPEGKYPVFEALYYGGASALLKLALQHGFSPDTAGYPSKCSLCFFMRSFLCQKDFTELDANHYEEALKYYSL
jgi:hypothetical protein